VKVTRRGFLAIGAGLTVAAILTKLADVGPQWRWFGAGFYQEFNYGLWRTGNQSWGFHVLAFDRASAECAAYAWVSQRYGFRENPIVERLTIRELS
jgi:hypothetical protein